MQALEKALELNPNAVDVRYHLGDALAEDGRLEAAARQFMYLACDDPELKEPLSVPGLSALMRMAECQGALGRWPEAVSTVMPAVWLAVYTLGHVAYIHQRAGEHRQAAALYSICLLLAPEDPELLHGAGYNKMKLGDLEEALDDLGQALKLDPKTPEIWYDYGIVLARMKRRSEARPIFRKVLRLDAKLLLGLVRPRLPRCAGGKTRRGIQKPEQGHRLRLQRCRLSAARPRTSRGSGRTRAGR